MERDIQEKQSIIDDLRSNLMELQLHSEHLSQSLFQERQERELVSAKVGHTRQLFLTLQEQHEQLTESVACFQDTKDEIQKEHDCLIEKLKAFKESFKLQEDVIEKLTLEAKENAHSFENAKESWERSILKKDQELKELNVQVENLKSEIQNLSKSLESTTSNLSSLQKEKTQLCSELDEVRDSLFKAEEQLRLKNEKLTEQITRADEELKLEHEQLVERTKEFQEAAEKIQYLKKVNDTLEGAKTRKKHASRETSEHEKKLSKKKNLLEQFKEQVTTLESDLEAKKTALMHLEEENKNKEEISHNLEVSLNEINKSNIICNEALQEMAQKISLTENHEAQLIEEKKKTEEELKKVSSDLKAKVQECEDLSTTIKELNEEIKTIEKECEVKIKNVSSETKSRRILEQKIHGLEEKLKKATKNGENQETELKKIKNVVTEKEKELEELKVSLDQSLCEKQEIQYRYEAKDHSFQSYQNYTTSNLETLKTELDLTKEILEKTKGEHEQQVLNLQEELEKAKETLNSSEAAHKIELQGVEKSLLEQNNISVTQFREEISSLTAKIEIMTRELEQVKEEASSAIKEKLHIKLESDNKVKEMSDLLDTYKTDKEAKLKVADEELKKSQSQITQLVQERDELLAKIKAQTKNCNTDEKEKVAITQAMKNEVEKILIPPSVSPSIRTPSPGSYLDTMNTFAKPSIPPAPRTIIKPEADKVQGKPVVSILKTRRRTLLPPEFQKRVVFKPLTHIKDYTSGDSSSDACALEAADSDEPFEEIKRAIRYPGIRQEKVPRANVAPFIPETNIPQKTPLPLNEHNMNSEVNKGPSANSSKRKRGRSDQQKQNMKTYSAVSPKNKQRKMP
ncbi:kinectin-like [Scylla paramamosain]|uniref:kinectin-like n=1 Tax=Scylla paramamosain TaxID=85552 RepID=UPI0030832BE0